MRRLVVGIALAAVIILGSSFAFSERDGVGGGVLSVLSRGQAVSLTDAGGRYEIAILTNGPEMLGYNVVAVGQDYVILEDIAHVREVRIPIYSVKAVVMLKGPK